MRRPIYVLGLLFFLGAAYLPHAYAEPTEEETDAFFARQRQDKADFGLSILEERNSRAAAIERFNRKAKSDRIAFQATLPGLSVAESSRRLDEYNARALQDKFAFQASLDKVPKNKMEKAVEDFDKKALADAAAFADEIATASPESRAEANRNFQNSLRQQRAQLINGLQNEINEKERRFNQEQAKKVADFFQ